MMLNKICVVVVALALAGAPISSLLAAAPSGGGGEPVSGGPVGAVPGVATGSAAKKTPIPTNRHHVAAPHGTRQPIVLPRKPVVTNH
jgi:hypothetical protein